MAAARLRQLRQAREAKKAAEEARTARDLPPPPPEHDRYARYRSDPVAFAAEVLGVQLYDRQEEILRALVTTKKGRIAVRSGHKCGKSTVAVIAALWTVCCFARARVILTATTGRQVRDVLWAELRRIYREAGGAAKLGGRMAKTPAGGFKYEDGREIIGFSTDTSENMAGYSGPHVLWIIDEASGFDEKVFEAVEGNAQSGARLFVISNPTKTVGFFFDAFHTRAAEWDRFRISSEEAAKHADRFPGLSRPEPIAERIARLGRDHPIVRVRILGEFPGSADNTVVSLHMVETGHETWRDIVARSLVANYGNLLPEGVDLGKPDWHRRIAPEVLAQCTGPELGQLELGVDVARFGDDSSIITPRRGKLLYPQTKRHGFDGEEVAHAALAAAKQLRKPHERVLFKVDGIGYGASVVDNLRRIIRDEPEWHGCEVFDVNVAVKSDDEEKFPNLRSQVWFAVADFLDEGGTLPPAANDDDDGALDAELMAPIYKFDPRARRVVESKADTKKRINRSPDRADSVALAVYTPPRAPPPKTGDRGRSRYADMGGYGRG